MDGRRSAFGLSMTRRLARRRAEPMVTLTQPHPRLPARRALRRKPELLQRLLGAAKIRGGRLFHIMSGNLSHQIERHLFPDLPAHRYQHIAPEVEEICSRYGLPYNFRGFGAQLTSTWKKIWRLARPNR